MRTAKPTGIGDGPIALPTAMAFVDVDEWDARARALGGTGNALLAGLAADVAQRVGRLTAEGSVDLAVPVNERTDGDTRANAVTNVDVVVDPAGASADLSGIRAAIKAALIRHQDIPDPRWALLPMTPLLPKRLVRRMVSVAAGGGTGVVSSNVGDIDPAVNRADGTDADYFTMRSVYPGVTPTTMHRAGGVLAFLSGRINGRVFISVLAYLPGQPNSDARLRQTISDALAAFGLASMRRWEDRVPVDQ